MRRFMVSLALAAIVSPAWAFADDQETAQQIARSLRASGRLSDYSIGVKYQEGTAWLSGRVATKQQMVSALAMAKNLPQVSRVVNNLEVQPSKKTQVVEEGSEIQQTSMPQPEDVAGGAEFEPQPVMSRPMVRTAGELPLPPSKTNAMAKKVVRKPTPVGTPMARAGNPNGAVRPTSANGANKPGAFVPEQARQIPPGYRMASNAKATKAGMPVQDAAGGPLPAYVAGPQGGVGPARYDQPHMPNHAWPAYAASPNYAAVTYPRQYSPSAWPYIGPFYPYPQVPLGWRKVTMEWDDGWWYLDFDDKGGHRHGR
jgi:hypothetical protein